jgi:HEAT repeat protein
VIRRDASEVYSKALAAALGVYLVNRLAEKELARVIHDPVFCWAAAFASVQTAVILVLSFSLLASRTYARLKQNLHEQIRPAIRDRVLALAFEGESWSSVVPQGGPGRRVLEDSIAQTLASVKAAGRERVARFAVEHGFAAEWAKRLSSGSKGDRRWAIFLLGLIAPVAGNTVLLPALADEQATVRAEAYRALLVTGGRAGVDRVFRLLLEESLLMRALLADDLKRHAGYLLANTIPRVLQAGTVAEVTRCFEMLVAWKRAMPSLDVRPWLGGDQDPGVRRLALALLPYVVTDDSIAEHVAAALESADIDVQCAAAEAAGRLKLERLMPLLERAVAGNSPEPRGAAERQSDFQVSTRHSFRADEGKRLALASATAMAEMGEAGERTLERILMGPDRKAAAVAMEALEHITVRSR